MPSPRRWQDLIRGGRPQKQLIESAPQAAVARIIALPPSTERNEILGDAGAQWVRRDATAALAWLGDLSPTDDKKRVATSMGYALALPEPLRETAWLSTLPDGRDRLLAIGAIGQTLVASDADQAWKWARQLPAGSALEAALAGIETGLGGARFRGANRPVEIVGRAGMRGIVGVSRSASSIPLGSERDQALRREFEEALRESPARAASWLASILIPDRRDEMVNELARRWSPINPQAARLWMDENNVAPGRR